MRILSLFVFLSLLVLTSSFVIAETNSRAVIITPPSPSAIIFTANGSALNHNDLASIQGGSASERYHGTLAQSGFWYNQTGLGAGGGTVTSITRGFGLNLTGTSITTSGTIDVNYTSIKNFTDLLYSPIGSTGNGTFNQTLTDLLYSPIKWNYNQTYTLGTFNSTYANFSYNQTGLGGGVGNASFNQTLTDILYATNGSVIVVNGIKYARNDSGIELAIRDLPNTGGTIFLTAGLYDITAEVDINKSNISIIGAGPSTKLIASAYYGGTAYNHVIGIGGSLANNTNITNVILSSFSVGQSFGLNDANNLYGVFVYANTSQITLENLYVSNGMASIIILGTDVLVRGNFIESGGDEGIQTNNAKRVSIINNVIRDVGYRSSQGGIRVRLSREITVANNLISRITRSGIRIEGTTYSTFTGNVLFDNSYNNAGTYPEIEVMVATGINSTNNIVANNIIIGQNASYGIQESTSAQDYNVYDNNMISGTINGTYDIKGSNSRYTHVNDKLFNFNGGLNASDPSYLNGSKICTAGNGACSAGNGTPGGSTTQIQFNNAGAFGGQSNLTFDKSQTPPLLTLSDANFKITQTSTTPSELYFGDISKIYKDVTNFFAIGNTPTVFDMGSEGIVYADGGSLVGYLTNLGGAFIPRITFSGGATIPENQELRISTTSPMKILGSSSGDVNFTFNDDNDIFNIQNQSSVNIKFNSNGTSDKNVFTISNRTTNANINQNNFISINEAGCLKINSSSCAGNVKLNISGGVQIGVLIGNLTTAGTIHAGTGNTFGTTSISSLSLSNFLTFTNNFNINWVIHRLITINTGSNPYNAKQYFSLSDSSSINTTGLNLLYVIGSNQSNLTGASVSFLLNSSGESFIKTNLTTHSDFDLNGTRFMASNRTNSITDRCTLVSGVCTIANAQITANTNVFCTAQSLGTVTLGQGIAVSGRNARSNYTITSGSLTDTSVIACILVEPMQ